MKSKIITVESEDIQEFTKLVNNYNDLFDVFATQTHVNTVETGSGYKMVYTAVIFYRVK